MSDLERDRHHDLERERHNFASELLDQLGNVLDSVDDVVTGLEDDSNILPTAIVRKCTEFADMIGQLAGQLEQQTDEERQQLATAIQQDIQQFDAFHRQDGLEFQETTTTTAGSSAAAAATTGAGADNHPAIFTTVSPASTTTDASSSSFATVPHFTVRGGAETISPTEVEEEEEVQVVEQQRNEILHALSGVSCLLRDVESSIRDIGRSEAEELADVGLTLVRLFLMSLQNFHETLTPEHVVEAAAAAAASSSTTRSQMEQEYYYDDVGGGSMYSYPPVPPSATKTRSSVVIEELLSADSDDDDDVENEVNDNNNTSTNYTSNNRWRGGRTKKSRKKKKKVRCLWPPLGPQVSKMMDWTKEEVIGKHPILAVALGLTLWPVAVTTAIVGTSAVVVDNAVQDLYNHFSDGPVVRNLEQGAAQLYQTGRLGYVTGKLVTRQTVRVVSRQIERHGGIGPVLDDVKSYVVDRIVHPIETAGMLWDGLNVCVGFVSETVGHVIAMKQEESDQTAQELS